MDLLIDLIVLLIKQATKSRPPAILPPTLQESQKQKTALARQMQAMQKNISAQQARTRPAAKRPGAARPAVGPPSWSQPGVRAVVQPVVRTVVAAITDAPLSRPATPATRIPGMKLPFLLGEVLGPPVALRETEY